jgi:hypothetical protein
MIFSDVVQVEQITSLFTLQMPTAGGNAKEPLFHGMLYGSMLTVWFFLILLLYVTFFAGNVIELVLCQMF